MGIATSASGVFLAMAVLLPGSAAHAQQDLAYAKPSPYSLALDAMRSGPGAQA